MEFRGAHHASHDDGRAALEQTAEVLPENTPPVHKLVPNTGFSTGQIWA